MENRKEENIDILMEGANEKLKSLKRKHNKVMVGTIVGGVAGILASAALGWMSNAYAPSMGSKAKDLVLKVGLGLTAGAVSNLVSNSVSDTVQETISMVYDLKDEIDKARNDKEVEICG